jgi:excisionase family DNA binding protein
MTAAISQLPAQFRPANDEQPAEPVLDVEDVARLLRVGRNTVYDLVGRNEIPHRRLGKQIRFSRDAVMSWLASWSSRDAKERQ